MQEWGAAEITAIAGVGGIAVGWWTNQLKDRGTARAILAKRVVKLEKDLDDYVKSHQTLVESHFNARQEWSEERSNLRDELAAKETRIALLEEEVLRKNRRIGYLESERADEKKMVKDLEDLIAKKDDILEAVELDLALARQKITSLESRGGKP